MLRGALKSERGMSSSEYAGILAIVATIFVAMFALNLDSNVSSTVRTAVCQILGGDTCGEETAATPEKCLTGKSTTSANANVFVAFVQIDKDSILIREDYSDGSSKFTIVDNTEAAGELLAGAKAKAGKYGFNASAEALAGIGLAGGKVFEFDNPEDAAAFQDSVQAAGGFDGIVRDLAGYDDEIPILGWTTRSAASTTGRSTSSASTTTVTCPSPTRSTSRARRSSRAPRAPAAASASSTPTSRA